jgi:hypothetical protein
MLPVVMSYAPFNELKNDKMSVKNYTDNQLLARVKAIPAFKKIPSGRWIVGVRSSEDQPDRFDDKFYEFEGEKFIRVLSGTTNPGLSILGGGFASYNSAGAAVLKSDEWYYDVWKYGLHKGKMPALLQLGSQVKIYRDGDRDSKTEESGKIHSGWFGINFHTNTYDFSKPSLKIKKDTVSGWSAGCQVSNDREKYAEMMEYYSKALKNGTQVHVSYCLLNEF